MPTPRPRRSAPPSGFTETWNENDANFLDPNSLVVGRIPRGWERKADIRKGAQGKEKKIWRRFNLRSRAEEDTQTEEEEEHDARSRAVKKLQHMSPRAMEKQTSTRGGKKNAFKATRWDRRKSALPRKKVADNEDSLVEPAEDEGSSENEDNDIHESIRQENMNSPGPTPGNESLPELVPQEEDTAAAFTFVMDSCEFEEQVDFPAGIETRQSPEIMDNAEVPTPSPRHSSPQVVITRRSLGSDAVSYPDLPESDEEAPHGDVADNVIAVSESTDVELLDAPDDEAALLEQSRAISEVFRDNVETPSETEHIPVELAGITYPTLPSVDDSVMVEEVTIENTTEVQEVELLEEPSLDSDSRQDETIVEQDSSVLVEDISADEEFTEASLQLDIQRQMDAEDQESLAAEVEELTSSLEQKDVHKHCEDLEIDVSLAQDQNNTSPTDTEPEESQHEPTTTSTNDPEPVTPGAFPSETMMDDIASGLTFTFGSAKHEAPTPIQRKLHSPPPPLRPASGPDDVTMTIALDDDTALLKDFLSRAAATKAEKAATTTHRRESLQNRRDSDVVRHALASPRKVLEEKDVNAATDFENEATLDLSQNLTLGLADDTLTRLDADNENEQSEKPLSGSRRSSRAKKSRLPAPASTSQAQASKIAIRRADGNDVVVLKKTDAQELSVVTRANTRKNKQGAFGVTVRLLKLAADAANLSPIDDSTKELIVGKNVRWDEQLAYYQENPETVADRESMSTPDELTEPSSTKPVKSKSKLSKDSTPKIRRVRGLGTANGTPGKGLLAPASLLPEAVQTDAVDELSGEQSTKPKSSKKKKMQIATSSSDVVSLSAATDIKLSKLEVAPVGVQPTPPRKSRLAAPRKVMLPTAVSTIAAEGKENTQRPGLGDAIPKKGIPVPKVLVPPSVGMESGLPRRRGRKY